MRSWGLQNWIPTETVRTGFAEVVYCENKADEDFLVEIFSRLFT